MHKVILAFSAAFLTTIIGVTPVEAADSIVVPENTLIVVTPTEEITSKGMSEGQTVAFMVVNDIVQDNEVVIRRGAPVQAVVTWRTGKGIVGKSAKFELGFTSVRAGSRTWKLRGKHRQEGRGNTAGALLGSMIITGRSAVMIPGQLVNVFTAEDIVFQPRVAAKSPQASAAPTQPARTTLGPDSGQNLGGGIRCITCN